MKSLLLIIAAILPLPGVVSERVDLIERSHVHCPDDGHCVLIQWVFYEWDYDGGRHRVIAWRFDRGQFKRSGNALIGTDNETLRKIEALSFRERWDMFDPEIEDRALWPQEKRRGLSP